MVRLLLLNGHLAIVLALICLPKLSVLIGCSSFCSHDILLLDAARLGIELLMKSISSEIARLRMICTYPECFLLFGLHLLLLLQLSSVLLSTLGLRCVLAALRLLLRRRAWTDRLANSLLD